MVDQKLGHYSFIIGVIIAIVLGLALPLGAQVGSVLTSILVLLGLVVGFMNVSSKATKEFLTISTILVIMAFAGNAATSLQSVLYVGAYLSGIFSALLAFIVPATIIVGLKAIKALAEKP